MATAIWSEPRQATEDVLARVEHALDAGRPEQALALADRLLRREIGPDAEARLRVVRALALWLSGAKAARLELAKARALERTGAPVALAHAEALFRWREMQIDAAWACLGSVPAGSGDSARRAAWLESGLLKDEGRLAAALQRIDDGLLEPEAAEPSPWTARLLAERGAVLTTLGRWGEARSAVDTARQAFAASGDPREHSIAGLVAAALDLATGDLRGVRTALDRAREQARSARQDPRSLADVLLLESDLQLASGAAAAAVDAASQALALFSVARDRRGRCRAHVRHAHALVSCGRTGEALVEARRACRDANDSATQIQAWADLAEGRVLLRMSRGEATRCFERARRHAGERHDLVQLADLGAALAAGEGRDSARLREALEGLAGWGDRRILALGVTDLRELLPGPAAQGPAGPAAVCLAQSSERALVDAAVALAGTAAWPERWAGALRALRSVAGWSYAALLGAGGLELRADRDAPAPLDRHHLLAGLPTRCAAPLVLRADAAAWHEHPLRLLLGLESAVVAPLPGEGALSLAFRDADGAARHAALVCELARLLGAHRPAAAAVVVDDDAARPFPEIVGRCDAMRGLFAEMERAAASEAFVHISGETGTGKGRVAQALHDRSRRRGGRFVALNASSLSDELFEAEMFGHARGAFTGAVLAREGYVAEAEGGTLFIDEVADLSPRAQAKLLRLLQEREYRRVGESAVRRADIRVISAANVDLEARVAGGLFREDLWYRLAVVTLRLPPLRERDDDLLRLARHFLRSAAARDGCAAPELSHAVAEALLRHDWPGNVRELENEMARLVAMAGGTLRPELLSARVRGGAPLCDGRLREALAAFERGFLKQALARNAANRAATARELGITRQALLGKMRRLGVA